MGGAPFSAQHPPVPMESAAVGPDLLVVALEAELLLLQGFLLGLQVSLGQAHIVQDLVQPTQVLLHRQAQGALTLLPSITEGANQPDAKESPSPLALPQPSSPAWTLVCSLGSALALDLS